MKLKTIQVAAVLIAIFGLFTLFMSSSVILDLFGIRKREGNYVLFIVWANLVCGILYLVASYGFYKSRAWTTPLLIFAVFLLGIAFISLLIYVNTGGIYENKTIGAMVFRMIVTAVFASLAWYKISKSKVKNQQIKLV